MGSTGGGAERCRRLRARPVNTKYTTAIAMTRRRSLLTLQWLAACVAARDEAPLYRRGDCGVPAGPSEFAAELIRLSLFHNELH